MTIEIISIIVPQSAEAFGQRLIILAAALMLDWLVGEPDSLWRRVPHPVVLFGKAITLIDRVGNRRRGVAGRRRRIFGVIGIAVLVGLASIIGYGLALGGTVITIIVVTILLAGRSLDDHIRAVAAALDGGVDAARSAVGMIVGRDTATLDRGDIARAAIETGAENLSDGVIAPAFWFLILGLPGLLIYKMVNTADSMIGYRNQRYLAFGWGAARLDDVLNYLPARLTALLICAAAGAQGRTAKAFATMRSDAATHQSPNAGWPEAAMAGAINVWLAGPRQYGARIRMASRFNAAGKEAGKADILTALRVLITAQILFGLSLILMALSIAPDALI
jgi:adenosylcobinamide-phosphate synthase